ncbi:domain containing protein [Chrysochromulina tobinii]|uniref:Domain containing protein n=1 Tax=Chrysochromulina tobinii TaxID=1460289 RepID=A0A0M0JY14_9EUKA|nr:domain containing protein [Chrysochromulina tobinii]|eukprot:KOO31546.1 domain containing protein [Chrysochromulina sp. CCMP291]
MATMCCSFICPGLFGRGRAAADGQLTEPLTSAVDGAAVESEQPPPGKAAGPSDTDPIGDAARAEITKILREVLETERSYVAALDALVTAFVPLLRPVIDASSGEELLTAACSLRGVHQELLQRLEHAGIADVWAVSRAFTTLTPFLRIYSSYCSGYALVLSRVKNARASTPALAELEGARGERLDSLLIRPVQRICKYPLFFESLLRVLPARAGPRPELEAAAAAVRRVNEEVNNKIKHAADGARLIALYHELGGKLPLLLAPSRSLLLEVEVKMSKPSRVARRKLYRLALLSDGLVVARLKRPRRRVLSSGGPTLNTTLALKAVLPLRSLTLEPARVAKYGYGPNARARGVAEKRPSSTHHVSSTGAVSSMGAEASQLLALNTALELECTAPVVRYTCRCEDAQSATKLLEAVASARAKLEQATKSNQRRTSLAASHAQPTVSEVESLVATARLVGSRRRSLAEALGWRSRRPNVPTLNSAMDTGAALTTALPTLLPRESRRAPSRADDPDEPNEALGLYGLVDEEAPGLYGIIYSSGDEEGSSDGSSASSQSDFETAHSDFE